MSSLVPPGRLLQATPSMGPDVNVFKDIDPNSLWDNIHFRDEMNYVGLPAKENIGMVLEVKAYESTGRLASAVR